MSRKYRGIDMRGAERVAVFVTTAWTQETKTDAELRALLTAGEVSRTADGDTEERKALRALEIADKYPPTDLSRPPRREVEPR